MPLTVRPYRKEDFTAVHALERLLVWRPDRLDMANGFITHPLGEQILDSLSKDGEVFVAMDGNSIVGMIAVGFSQSAAIQYLHPILPTLEWFDGPIPLDGCVWIERLSVDPSQHRSGIGMSLMNHVVKLHPTQRMLTAVVAKPTGNEAARSFYEKHSFTPVARYVASSYQGLSPYESIVLARPIPSDAN